MKRDIELIRIAIAAVLVALAILAGLFAVAVMADGPDFSPPELPTMTPPPPVGTVSARVSVPSAARRYTTTALAPMALVMA